MFIQDLVMMIIQLVEVGKSMSFFKVIRRKEDYVLSIEEYVISKLILVVVFFYNYGGKKGRKERKKRKFQSNWLKNKVKEVIFYRFVYVKKISNFIIY